MMKNSDGTAVKEVEEIAELFGSQVKLASALGISNRNVTEWKRHNRGIPPKHYRRIYIAAQEQNLQLPAWFPRFQDHAA